MCNENESKSAEEDLKNIFSTINQCLTRKDDWKLYYSSKMDEITANSVDKSQLYNILSKEKSAFNEYTIGNYLNACNIIQEIVNLLSDSERGWYLQLLAKYKFAISKVESQKIQMSAYLLNNELLKPANKIEYKKINYKIDDSRITLIKKKFKQYNDYQDLKLDFDNIISNLCFGNEADKFERAVQSIGEMLGFISHRPDKFTREGPDNLWCIGKNKYVLIECKSEVKIDRKTIYKTEAGQMEEHCGWFENKYGNSDVINVLIISTNKLNSDAYFSHNIKILTNQKLEKFKKDLRKYLIEYKKYDIHTLTHETINSLLISYNYDSDDFISNYLVDPVK